MRSFLKHFTERNKIFTICGENFVAGLLPEFICAMGEITQHGSITFCIWELISIQITDRGDNRFGQFIVTEA